MRAVFSNSTKHAFFFVLRMDAVVVGRYAGLSHGTGVYWPVAHGCGGIRLDSTWRHGLLSPPCALPSYSLYSNFLPLLMVLDGALEPLAVFACIRYCDHHVVPI